MPESRRRLAPSFDVSEQAKIDFAHLVRADRSMSALVGAGALMLAEQTLGPPRPDPVDDDPRVATALQAVETARADASSALERGADRKTLRAAAAKLAAALKELQQIRQTVHTERDAARQRTLDERLSAWVAQGIDLDDQHARWDAEGEELVGLGLDAGRAAELRFPTPAAFPDHRARLERALAPAAHVNGRRGGIVRTPGRALVGDVLKRYRRACIGDPDRDRPGDPELAGLLDASIGEWRSLRPAAFKLAVDVGILEPADAPTPLTPARAEPLVRLRVLRGLPPNNPQEIIHEPQSRAERYVAHGLAEVAPEAAP